ncbi:ABC transporter permease subunit [Phycicoccus sp. SLBN-51]|jgi:putative spermidine/putrescine transport system permease protein|uniref:ABC transporter permease n=1 Tax=Phycicoccus sp. SLBN-51 TaxID=2768447 RepID=UPI0011521149|nr:ABC transporter permease subunit [Phycicoccus sp. SLBN-51]TQJ51938.1 putative spermidine/putrescine transport system permease protein [Phycicoccus sp. SLBN-51]
MTTLNPTAPSAATGTRRRIVASPGGWLVWGAVVLFMVFLVGIVGSVLVNSFGTRWFGTWLPEAATTQWYSQAWTDFSLMSVIIVTLEVAAAVVVLSVLVGVPASYVLARRDFPGKKVVYLAFLLPIMMPPITYGIPLATVLYKFNLAGNITGVILANLVPCVPFVILTMTPFIEQIDPAIERAARMSGARTFAIFTRILAPLLVPGILASSILVLVRTVGMFELTFLTAGPDSSTLVVALFNSMNAAGIRAQQSVDAMAVIYMTVMMVLLVIALRFVNPTQLVAQVKEEPEP